MTDQTLGQRMDRAAIRDQRFKRAAKQLQNAANNMTLAADHATFEHDNRERHLWNVIQSLANLVGRDSNVYMAQLQSRVEDLQAFILNQEEPMEQMTDGEMDAALEDAHQERVFEYLDKLRESGVVNMFGAGPHVQEEFDVDKKEAGLLVGDWMRTFSDRHPQ